MSVQHQDLDRRCLEALAIAIPLLKDILDDEEDVEALRLTCKDLRDITRSLITRLWFHGANSKEDFEVLKFPFLENIRKIDIISGRYEPKVGDGFRQDKTKIKLVLKMVSPTLYELSMHRHAVPAAEILEGTGSWPRLKRFSLDGQPGNLVGIKNELLSMTSLHTLSIVGQQLNEEDAAILLSAPFLSNLTELTLNTWDAAGTTEYMSQLLEKATNLETLVLHGEVDFDFPAPFPEPLKHLKLENYSGNEVKVHFGSLLAQPRPHLRSLAIQGFIVTTEELDLLIDSAKTALPNLERLLFSDLCYDPHDMIDQRCLARIDLPNLIELRLHTAPQYAARIAERTVKLPKLKILDLGEATKLFFVRLNWTDAYEKLFSSPLVQQLTTLRIPNERFDDDSMRFLCKYASKMQNLENLTVHFDDTRGADILAACGKEGGFPNLKKIVLPHANSCLWNGKVMIAKRLHTGWPKIEYEYHVNDCYIPPDEIGWDPPRDFHG
jgi:hypothetical protein